MGIFRFTWWGDESKLPVHIAAGVRQGATEGRARCKLRRARTGSNQAKRGTGRARRGSCAGGVGVWIGTETASARATLAKASERLDMPRMQAQGAKWNAHTCHGIRGPIALCAVRCSRRAEELAVQQRVEHCRVSSACRGGGGRRWRRIRSCSRRAIAGRGAAYSQAQSAQSAQTRCVGEMGAAPLRAQLRKQELRTGTAWNESVTVHARSWSAQGGGQTPCQNDERTSLVLTEAGS